MKIFDKIKQCKGVFEMAGILDELFFKNMDSEIIEKIVNYDDDLRYLFIAIFLCLDEYTTEEELKEKLKLNEEKGEK